MGLVVLHKGQKKTPVTPPVRAATAPTPTTVPTPQNDLGSALAKHRLSQTA